MLMKFSKNPKGMLRLLIITNAITITDMNGLALKGITKKKGRREAISKVSASKCSVIDIRVCLDACPFYQLSWAVRIVTLVKSHNRKLMRMSVNNEPTATKTLNAPSTIGLIKSKSGCFGLMTSDLNNELRNRLKSSEHATVTNLRKSCTTSDSKLSLETDQTATTTLHDDAVSLVRNLSSLGKLPTERRLASSSGGDGNDNETEIASTSEGESSGGREISEIIKNSAIARRHKYCFYKFLTKQ
uniref:Uncharacterized protein n=1 Tax=Glossina pallidipes TaxID=7398 RepID=A0A1A9ZMK9_GLOPL